MDVEPDPGRNSTYAIAVAFMMAAQAPLGTLASSSRDDGEYIRVLANFEEAVRSPWVQQWQEAEKNEYSGLIQHDVYRLIRHPTEL